MRHSDQGLVDWVGVKMSQVVKATTSISLFYISELPGVVKGLLAQGRALPEYMAIICPPSATAATEAGFAYVFSCEEETQSMMQLHYFPLPKKMTYVLFTNGLKIALINFIWNYLTAFIANSENIAAKSLSMIPSWLFALPFVMLLIKENLDFGLRTALMARSHSSAVHKLRQKKTDAETTSFNVREDYQLGDIIAGETKSLLSYFVQLILLNIVDCVPGVRYPAMIVWVLLLAQQMFEYRLGDNGLSELMRKTFFARNVGFVGSLALPPIMISLFIMMLMSSVGINMWSLGVFPLLVDLLAIPMTGLAEIINLGAADVTMDAIADREVLDHLRSGTHFVFDGMSPYLVNIATSSFTLYRQQNHITQPTVVRMIVKALGLVHRIIGYGFVFPKILYSQEALARDPVVRDYVLEYLQLLDEIMGNIEQKQNSAVGFLLLKFPRVGCGLLYLLYNLPGSVSGEALRSLNNLEETAALSKLRLKLQALIRAIKAELAKPVMNAPLWTRLTGGVARELGEVINGPNFVLQS